MARLRSPAPLEAHLGYWLRFVSNHVSHGFSLKLEARDVSVAEWVLLRELHGRDGMMPSDLAARMGMTRGAISKLADRLVAKSLITRTASKDDGRYQALALTAKGSALVPELAALADDNEAEMFGHMKAAERKTIEKAMKEFVRVHGLRTIPIS
ncbi:MAG: MarR family transcriptional regulator [Afipia sp.]|jgi:DNA-binding MarR family transcriptional regulator|nr:MarR family transcriptional regulator [Afipia sp.]